MAYHLTDDKFEQAVVLFVSGKSIRDVAKAVGIARETANRIQKLVKLSYLEAGQPFQEITGGQPRGGKIVRKEIPVGTTVEVRNYLFKRFSKS